MENTRRPGHRVSDVEALRRKAERLELVLEGTRLGLWDWNPQTDEVHFDARWAEMLGHRPEEISDTLAEWSSRVHPDDLPGCLADIARHVRGETAFYENVHRMRHATRGWVWILDRGKVVERDDAGRPVRFTGTHTDISAQKEAEAAAREANRTKSLFLARMSHEIRTPLNGLLGVLQLFDDGSLDDSQRGYLGVMRESGEGLLAIVDDILDLAKVEAGELAVDPRPFDPAAAATSVVDLFRERAAQKRLRYTLDVARDVPTRAQADGHRFRQIVANLVSNAVKFTAAGFVSVRLWSRVSETDATLELEVADSGPGIEDPSTLFQPYRQETAAIAREHGGTGLGLAIARQLAELMGGRLTVQSRVGSGSTFRLTLPVERLPEDKPDSDPDTVAPEVRDDLRVLVADDNGVNRLVVGGMLRRVGLAATFVQDGVEAVEACARSRFDVVLMDVHMPRMGGFEATRAIRDAHGEAAPWVVALSADALAENRDACLAAGMSAFVSKPLRFDELVRVLSDASAPGSTPPPRRD